MEYLIIWKYHDTHVEYYDFYDDAMERATELKTAYKNDSDFELGLYQINEIDI